MSMALDALRQKVAFHNSVDVWIAACGEAGAEWRDHGAYRRFIAHLLAGGLAMRAFNLCAHEAGAEEGEKARFAEGLRGSDDPNSLIYTVRLSDAALALIRAHAF